MTDLIDHHGEIRRREHYQGLACIAEKERALTAQTMSDADAGDSSILELLLSDTAVAK